MPSRILFVEDDPVVCELIQQSSVRTRWNHFHSRIAARLSSIAPVKTSARFFSMCACRRRMAETDPADTCRRF